MRSNPRLLLLLAVTLAALALLGGWMSIPINAEARAAMYLSSGTTLDPARSPPALPQRANRAVRRTTAG